MNVLIEKKVMKELKSLPKTVVILFRDLVKDLEGQGLSAKGWDIKKMAGSNIRYRVRLNYRYRVIIEVQAPDLIIIKVSSREGAY